MARRKPSYIITSQKILSDEEYQRFIELCERQQRLYPLNKDPLMLLLLSETGLRANELLGLRIKDFDASTGSIFIRSLKGSNQRELPLKPRRSAQLMAFILRENNAEFLHQINQDDLIFKICYQRFYQIWAYYRPSSKKTMHSLRHTFAVKFFERTKDIKALQIALGHRNIDNTMVYLDFVYNKEVMRKLMYG